MMYFITEFCPGKENDEVLSKAYNDDRILLTEDKNFGGLVFLMKKPAKSIVLLRFPENQYKNKTIRLNDLIINHSNKLVIL